MKSKRKGSQWKLGDLIMSKYSRDIYIHLQGGSYHGRAMSLERMERLLRGDEDDQLLWTREWVVTNSGYRRIKDSEVTDKLKARLVKIRMHKDFLKIIDRYSYETFRGFTTSTGKYY